MMKIYTKTGDKGETSLAMGGRVKKYDSRVDLYGTADELNSVIGIVIGFLEEDRHLEEFLRYIQNLLFELGSELAGFMPQDDSGNKIPVIHPEDIENLEKQMDAWQEELPELKHFILPGGTKASSFLHQARTVCRRLERSMVYAGDNGLDIPTESFVFINRLSDALFLASRIANFHANQEEPKWVSRAKKK